MRAERLLRDLLKGVSRSFYLTLRVLPKPVRSQLGLAYLLARTADTIADTELVPAEKRLEALRRYADAIRTGIAPALDFRIWAERQGNSMEKALLRRGDEALRALREFRRADQEKIQAVLAVIISGQELDLIRFNGVPDGQVRALQTAQELEDYTYRVAGCVGEFWTKMCRAHLFPNALLDEKKLIEDGVRFGKGLQRVNILRDVPEDLCRGRCYLPADELSKAGLKPEDLLVAGAEERFRAVYDQQLARAEEDLRAAWRYTNSIPKNQIRVRLACAWPVLIGVRTLELLRSNRVLDGSRRIKVSRKEVRQMMVRSVVSYPFGKAWERLPRLCRQSGKAFASPAISQ